jgi:hypothetical protein
MKNRARILTLLAICMFGIGRGTQGGEQPLPKPLRLQVSLTDGSVLLGQTALESLPFIPEGMIKTDIQLGYIDAITFSQDQPAVVLTFRNGDRMRGTIDGPFTVPLNTLVGPVSAPMAVIREIRVRAGGNEKVVDWVILPFPKNSDWRDEGEPAQISPEEIVFKGQPVWTEQTLFAPLTIEFDAALDQLVSDDGCIWVILIPDGPYAELYVPPQNVAIQLGYHNKGEGSGMFTIYRGGGAAPNDLGMGPFNFEAGKPHHLKIEVAVDSIRATLDGQSFEDKRTLPFKKFHIELMGWQPSNTWRVRNLVVY